MKQTIYTVVGSAAALLVATMLVTAWIWPVLHEVETGATTAYPDIQPHYYSTEPARIYDEALAAVEALPRWTVVNSEASARRIEAERSGRFFGFTDDVTIQVEPVTEFVSQVNVRSQSRSTMSPTDYGQNARNIEEFLSDLDDRLGAVKFEPHRASEENEPDEESDEESAPRDLGEG